MCDRNWAIATLADHATPGGCGFAMPMNDAAIEMDTMAREPLSMILATGAARLGAPAGHAGSTESLKAQGL